MLKLPKELWMMILRIKTRLAVKERLEKILEFPQMRHGYKRGNDFIYIFETSIHHWSYQLRPFDTCFEMFQYYPKNEHLEVWGS